jgi:hypothetical protein
MTPTARLACLKYLQPEEGKEISFQFRAIKKRPTFLSGAIIIAGDKRLSIAIGQLLITKKIT